MSFSPIVGHLVTPSHRAKTTIPPHTLQIFQYNHCGRPSWIPDDIESFWSYSLKANNKWRPTFGEPIQYHMKDNEEIDE